MSKAEKAKKMMRAMIAAASLDLIIQAYKESEKQEIMVGAVIREVIMDELEKRYPEKFDEWLWDDNNDFAIFAA